MPIVSHGHKLQVSKTISQNSSILKMQSANQLFKAKHQLKTEHDSVNSHTDSSTAIFPFRFS